MQLCSLSVRRQSVQPPAGRYALPPVPADRRPEFLPFRRRSQPRLPQYLRLKPAAFQYYRFYSIWISFQSSREFLLIRFPMGGDLYLYGFWYPGFTGLPDFRFHIHTVHAEPLLRRYIPPVFSADFLHFPESQIPDQTPDLLQDKM